MATRPKAVIESRNGEKFSPITIAKNVLTDDGQNLHDILSDRKEDMMTPTIENSSSMFKVGQGDNVDYSENVVDGAYESCVLKGRSLVNVDSYYSKDDFFMQNIDTISTDGYIRLTASGLWKNSFTKFNGMLKPNTKYLAIVDIKTNTLASGTRPFRMFTNGTNSDGTVVNVPFVDQEKGIECGVTGTFKYILTTRGDLSTCVANSRNYVSNTVPSGVIEYRYVLIEYVDGMEHWEIPFFRGICDCKSPILSNVGKNLFDYKNYGKQDINIVEIENGLRVSTWATSLPFINNLLPNTKYTSKSVVKVVEEQVGATDIGAGKIYIYNGTNYFLLFNVDGGKYVFTTPSDIKSYNRILFYAHGGGGSKVGVVDITNIQLEETSSATTYEPYKSNTTTFDQKDGKTIVLRSLPNGVCDTLNVETGEYVQRIGDYTVNGTETSWFTYIDTTGANNNYLNQTSCAFGIYLTGKAKGNGILCDKLPTRSIGWWGGNHTGEGICGIDNDNRIFLRVKNEKTGVLYTDNTSTALEKVKTYLASNPVTVQYELATPIVKQINVEGYPYAYENGHVLLESGSQEQSLTPKVEYSVATNRNGQIRSNQRMVERHQKQLDRLQAIILTNLVNTQYEQTLTNLKYDLKNVREEVK